MIYNIHTLIMYLQNNTTVVTTAIIIKINNNQFNI